MKASLGVLLRSMPGPISEDWPSGEPFIEAFRHGSMSVEIFSPRGRDAQTPHDQDELYFIVGGTAVLNIEDVHYEASSGDAFFVAARQRHNFCEISDDFVTWVVFWGPNGGETER